MKMLLRVAVLVVLSLMVVAEDDDFFDELDDIGSSDLNSSTPDPFMTEAPILTTNESPGPSKGGDTPVINYDGTPVANYTPEIGYRMADKLSDQVRLFLKHFQQPDPIGIPGAVLPDPMPLPDITSSLSFMGSISFRNIKLYELSQFRLSHINTDLEDMQVYVEIELKRLVSLGNYTMKTMFAKGSGPFNITMETVVAEGAVRLERDENGQLQAAESDMDMSCKKFYIQMKNSGVGTLTDTMGPLMFQSIKPVLLKKINTDVRADINKQLKKFTAKIPKNVSPLDLGIYEARRYVRNHHYDPYQLKNLSYKIKGARLNITNVWLEGLSNFNRVGDLSLSMDHGIIQFGIHVITSKLKGFFNWALIFNGKSTVIERGMLNFDVEHLQVKVSVNQSVNINNKPVIDDIDIRVGKINITHHGQNALDIVINSIVNKYIPEYLKNIIIDSLEQPIKKETQDILDRSLVGKYSIDNILNDKVLPKLDEFVTIFSENKTYANVTYDTTPASFTTLPTEAPTTTASIPAVTPAESTGEFTTADLSLNELEVKIEDAVSNATILVTALPGADEVKSQAEAVVEKVVEAVPTAA